MLFPVWVVVDSISKDLFYQKLGVGAMHTESCGISFVRHSPQKKWDKGKLGRICSWYTERSRYLRTNVSPQSVGKRNEWWIAITSVEADSRRRWWSEVDEARKKAVETFLWSFFQLEKRQETDDIFVAILSVLSKVALVEYGHHRFPVYDHWTNRKVSTYSSIFSPSCCFARIWLETVGEWIIRMFINTLL